MNNLMSRMNHTNWPSPSLEKVTIMRYHLEDYRTRSVAALGLALTTSIIAIVTMLVSAL